MPLSRMEDQPDYRAERFGKTVLMKCIVGLLTPDKGELLYDHRNFLAMGKKEKKALRREMGMIFQSAALFDSMTVLDNVMFPLNMFSNDTCATGLVVPCSAWNV